MPADLQKARELFLHAVGKLPPDEWDGYVAEASRGDAELGRQVGRLLQVHREVGSFLDQPAAPLGATWSFAPAAAAVPLRERPGTIIGPYKLLQQIGEGGMGAVFMAEQTHPVQRKVALKVIKAGMDCPQVIARFEAERQALALMDHVNIARVFDAGATESGLPYFVMELVHGVPITKYCDDNHLTPRERLELFVPVCLAIQHAHQKGVIHRDVKPSNVMITLYDGKPVPKVIDFGVAKATEQRLTERTLFTQYGAMVGTLEYMSPEQAEMSALGIDTRSDVYSLGVLLYELLTGSTPLIHKRIREVAYGEVLRRIKEEEPPRPSTRLTDSGEALATISAQRHMEPAKLATLVRGELDWIVMKTLEKDRNRRYPTVSGFAADVQRYLNDEPVQACPPTVGYRFRKFARRNKRMLATVGVLALALIAGTAVSAWQAVRATGAEGLAQTRLQAETEAQSATHSQLRLTEEAQETATRRLYEARLAQARAGSLSRRSGQRLDSLDALAEAAEIARGLNLPPDSLLERRNTAIACLALTDLRLSKQGLGWPASGRHVDFDGQMEQVAVVDKQGAISIRRVADDVEIAHLAATGSETWVLFSRDGKFLAVFWPRGLHVLSVNLWKLGGNEPVRVEQLDDANGFDFSSDSRQCVIGRVDGSIHLYDLASGQPPRELPKGRPGAQLAFHPDGRQLAVSCDTSVEIRALDTGEVVADLQGSVAPTELAWRPDGKTLAVVGSDSRIYLWDVSAPNPKQPLVIAGIRNGGVTIAFDHAGDLLASTGWEGKLRLWDPETGKQLFSTMSGAGIPRFSPDDHLLSGDGRDGKLRFWEVAAGGEYRTLLRAGAAGQGEYDIMSIRSDGRLLAVGMWNGVGLWELPSGKELSFLESPGTNFVLFEPSGDLLTNGASGLSRWPVRDDAASPGLLRIGPPLKLPVPGPICHIACSADSRVIAVSQFQGGSVLHTDRPDQPVHLTPHRDARYIAVSLDGLWAVTASHNGTGVKIWDAQTGDIKKELLVDGSRVGFSPDGKWLATNGDGLRLWAVGSWQEGPRIGPRIGGGVFAFCPDLASPSGKLLAVDTGDGAVRLVDPDTGREYARLEDPDQDRAFDLRFNADGTQLIVSSNDSRSVHVWDLRAIRERLAKMGLDWELPPYPPAAPDLKPLRVEVDLGDPGATIQAQAHEREADGFLQAKQWDRAVGAYAEAVGLDPKNARYLNDLAWLLATCPDADSRDGDRALELAARAVQLEPKDGNYWITLGAAQYRVGDWKPARESLEKAMALRNGGDCADWFFLAMVHWRLGDKAEARQWYDKADLWMATHHHPGWPPLRSEAAELMKIESGVENPESPKKQTPP